MSDPKPQSPAAPGTPAAVAPEIRIETRGAAGVVSFDRPRALNAITTAMRAALADALPGFARSPLIYCMVLRSESPKAFSAGGDVRELTAWGRSDPARARAAFADEYRLDWALDCFTKPTISLIDGIVMGSGVGLSLYGTHRVAGAGYKFAMPETMIGLFPDVGVAHAFARMPDHVGMYLGLTGRTIGRADAFQLGLVTHCIDAALFPTLLDALADAQPVDPLLDAHHADPGPAETLARRDAVRRIFSAATLTGVLDRLAAEAANTDGPDAEWAAGVHRDLLARSPTSLALTFRHIREAAARTLDEVLAVDYRLACRCLDGHDFHEGVRALLVDKDGAPRWQPDSIAGITPALVEAYFAPLAEGELGLAPRTQMQAIR